MPLLLRAREALSVRKRRHDLPALRELLALTGGSRLLDVGGGAGAATALFAAGARRVVVLEPDSRKIRFGRRRRPAIEFVEGHAERIPFPDESFDRAVAVVSFHHVEDPDRALQEARRVLAPTGRLVLHELYPENHSGVFPRLLGRRTDPNAPHFYEPQDLRRRVEGHGFREVSIRDGVRGYFVVARK